MALKKFQIIFGLLLLGLFSQKSFGQSAYEHVSNEGIYSFIDHLASIHLIQVNTAVKPYSRVEIAKWLEEAKEKELELSKPLRAQLNLYLQEYSMERDEIKTGLWELFPSDTNKRGHVFPPEGVWKDKNFRFLLRPVYGMRVFNSTNAGFFHSYGFGEMIGYYGKNLSFYASFRDHHQSNEALALPTYLTREPGGAYKINVQQEGGADYSEMRGGINYDWTWGTIGFIKDHIQWGDNYNGSNILSGRSPSFPMIKLQLKPVHWFDFNYFHGWLVSEVIDSARSYITANGDYRAIFREKYIAANIYTFRPWPRLNLSLGNTIVYSDGPVQIAYLLPFSFFKSIDHTLNKGIENQNSSLFFNVSSRQIKHLHVYGSLYFDELSFFRITDPTRHNFYSIKGGASISGWPFKGLFIAGEFTHTNPLTYKHRVPATTFATNRVGLGHHLLDNSQDIFAQLRYNVFNTIRLSISYNFARHGNEYQYVFGPVKVDEFPILQNDSWTSETIRLRADYMPFPNIRLFTEFIASDVRGYDLDGQTADYYLNRFGPSYLHGSTNTLIVGIGIGY
jgi:hypothetical protein